MVDIAGLPGNVTASDFVFMVGNSNDPSTWTQLTVAPTVTVRWGAGVQGSARVELTWPNNTIENEWLQVTVLADADTGFSANDVFYYGNAIGDTGNSTTNGQAQVNRLGRGSRAGERDGRRPASPTSTTSIATARSTRQDMQHRPGQLDHVRHRA